MLIRFNNALTKPRSASIFGAQLSQVARSINSHNFSNSSLPGEHAELSQYANAVSNGDCVHGIIAPIELVNGNIADVPTMASDVGFRPKGSKRAYSGSGSIQSLDYSMNQVKLNDLYVEEFAASSLNSDNVLDDRRVSALAVEQLMLNVEFDLSRFMSAFYVANSTRITVPSTKWDQSGAQPFDDVNSKIKQVPGKAKGLIISFGRTAWDLFRVHANAIAKVNGLAGGAITEQQAANAFGVKAVIVATAQYLTKAGVLTDIFADNVDILCHPGETLDVQKDNKDYGFAFKTYRMRLSGIVPGNLNNGIFLQKWQDMNMGLGSNKIRTIAIQKFANLNPLMAYRVGSVKTA